MKRDRLYLIRGSKKVEIPFTQILAVHLVYRYDFAKRHILSHLTIKYRDEFIFDNVKTLKLGVASWNPNDIAELYRYLSFFRERYRYDIKVVKSLIPFIH